MADCVDPSDCVPSSLPERGSGAERAAMTGYVRSAKVRLSRPAPALLRRWFRRAATTTTGGDVGARSSSSAARSCSVDGRLQRLVRCFPSLRPPLSRNTVTSAADDVLVDNVDLDAGELRLIRESYDLASAAHVSVGLSVLTRLLCARPNLAVHFDVGTEAALDPSALSRNEAVLVQSGRIDAFLQAAVYFTPTASLRAQCRHVGRVHYHKSVNFDRGEWDMFATMSRDAVVDCAAGHLDARAVATAWGKLMLWITNEMQAGFLEETVLQAADDFTRLRSCPASVAGSQLVSFDTADSDAVQFNRRAPSPSASAQRPVHTARGNVGAGGRQLAALSVEEAELVEHLWLAATTVRCHSSAESDADAEPRDELTASLGMKIVVTLLLERPSLALVFGLRECAAAGAEWDGKMLAAAAPVRLQACRLDSFFASAVYLCKSAPPGRLDSLCAHVGRVHFHKGVNFTADNWLVFKRVVLDSLVPRCAGATAAGGLRTASADTLHAVAAVDKFMRLIVAAMKRGFLEAACKGTCK